MAIPLFPKHLCVSTLPQISTGMGSVFSREILYRARCAQQEVFLFVFGSFASFEKFQQMDASRCILQDRASAMEWLLRPQVPAICHGDVLFIETSADHFSKKYTSTLSVGISLRFRDCLDALLEFGYIFEVGATSCASFCHEGDILHIRNRLGQKYTISWFGDEIEWIKDSEEVSYQNLYFCHKALSECATGEELLAFDTLKTPIYLFDSEFETRQQHFPQNLLHEFSFRNDQAPQEVPLQCESLDALKIIIESSAQSFVYSRRSHIGEVLKKHGIIPHHIQKTSISGESVYFPHDNSAIIADDLLSKLLLRPRTPVSHRENHTLLLTIHPHDYVVHQDHGIGQFLGITLKEIYGEKKEYFSIGFFAGDKVLVPLTELGRVTKYVGADQPKLAKLGNSEWKKTLESTQAEILEIAGELLETAAQRTVKAGVMFRAFPQEESAFTAAFPYDHTLDQLSVIQEIYADMESSRPMDRLICGDVGFGKTEVAMHAMYRAVLNGYQVACISPLVVLALEHGETLKKRFAPFSITVECITRLTSKKESERIAQGVKSGKIQILVGTHRILTQGNDFKRLGLLVLDEEHKFGVSHKEAIKALQSQIDVLALSATPIPRSLNMALSGLRSVSQITTPPQKKKAIESRLLAYSDEACIIACQRELDRQGQVLVIESRIARLQKQETFLLKRLTVKDGPNGDSRPVKILTLHGGMDGTELDDHILAFKQGHYDILLATTVIENGVNFLRANSIIILQSEQYGLASLHQLRGRVGRKDIQAYCYFFYDPDKLTPETKKRLGAIQRHSYLGAGYEIAMQDLQIRGAGDILGIRQSGKTNDVGISLYMTLLEDAISALKTGKQHFRTPCKIDLPFSLYLEDELFESEADKMQFYRGLEAVRNTKELDTLIASFDEGLQSEHAGFKNLCLLLRAKLLFERYHVSSVSKVGAFYMIDFPVGTRMDTLRAILELDTEREATVLSGTRIRIAQKPFITDTIFLKEYIRRMEDLPK